MVTERPRFAAFAALPRWSGMALNERDTAQLRIALQGAVVKCSERCLYQSAKWYVTQSMVEFVSLICP